MSRKQLFNVWLKPVEELILSNEFEEAYALADYLPATDGRKLHQCASLIGQNKLYDADFILKEIQLKFQEIAPFFCKLFNKEQIINIILKATQGNHFDLAYLCLECQLYNNPKSSNYSIDNILELSEKALKFENKSFGIMLINRAMELNNSLNILIKCAGILLISRSKNTKEDLTKLANKLINQARNQLEDNDIENRLKLAKLLAIDSNNINNSFNLLKEVYQLNKSKDKEIASILVPLIEYKSYYSSIADFLIEISPSSISEIVNKMMYAYQNTKNIEYLEKSKSLIKKIDYIQRGYILEFTKSILALKDHIEIKSLEYYSKRLSEKIVDSNTIAKFAETLLNRQSSNYNLITNLLDKALTLNENLKPLIVNLFVRLIFRVDDQHDLTLRDELITKTFTLTSNLNEFLEWAGKNNSERLMICLRVYYFLKKASWYDENISTNKITELISNSPQYTKIEAFDLLAANYHEFKTDHYFSIIEAILNSSELSDDYLASIRSKIFKLPFTLRATIEKLLLNKEKQLLRDRISVGYKRRIKLKKPRDFFRAYRRGAGGAGRPGRSRVKGSYGGSASVSSKPKRRKKRIDESEITVVERHTKIIFPHQCEAEKKVKLKIQLLKEIPEFTRVLQKIKLDFGIKDKNIILNLNITAQGFAIQNTRKPMEVPFDKDSEEVIFTLFPVEEGEQAVEIEFFYQTERIGYFIVKTEVKTWNIKDEPTIAFSIEEPINRLENIFTTENKKRRIIHVSWIEREGTLNYTIYSEKSHEFGEWEKSVPNIKSDITDYLRDLNAFLTEAVVQGKPEEENWESINFNLQSIGKNLFNELLPSKVAESVKTWEDNCIVLVSTNEQWIPWELLHDGKEFLGYKFIIARYPRLSDRYSLPNSNRPVGDPIRTISRFINVIGGDLPEKEAERAEKLFYKLSSSFRTETLAKKPVSVLEKLLKKADGFHLTCHGYLNPHILQIANKKSITLNILPQTIHNLPIKFGSFVFANACASSAPVLTFGKFSNFGWEFYRRGADIYIGTLGAVPVKYAIPFAETVYQTIFSKINTKSVGEVVQMAKQKYAKSHNVFWLFYTIYGDPDIVIQTTNP